MRLLLCLCTFMAFAGPEIKSISVITFASDGTLLIGDSKGGQIFAIPIKEAAGEEIKELNVSQLEAKMGSLIGVPASQIMVHDMATHPISKNVYFSISKGRSKWVSMWTLPNDLTDADILIRMDQKGKFELVDLSKMAFTSAKIPNPVDDKPHMWKEGVSLRADTITDIAMSKDKVLVAGLSNEEFSSTLWQFEYPFKNKAKATTLEVFHGAHGKYETHAPIRAFLPIELNGKESLLAAYLCTPFVRLDMDQLQDGAHVKGKTLGEFGSGNYPYDMVRYKKNGEDRILVLNSNLPIMVLPVARVAEYEGEITEKPKAYIAGLPYDIRPGAGLLQIDNYDENHLVGLHRKPSGSLDVVLLPTRRL